MYILERLGVVGGAGVVDGADVTDGYAQIPVPPR
jgi:hypothetical protein